MVAGLTGRYCAGKSSVAAYLRDRGWLHIDVDVVGHTVLAQQPERIARHFGSGVLDGEGQVDRSALGRMVFADSARLRELEAILHPAMKEDIRQRIAAADSRPVVIDAALLFPMQLDNLCDAVLIIRAPMLLRMWRAWRRDARTPRQFLQRNRSQRGFESQAQASPADIYSVSNWGFRGRVLRSVDAIL